MKNPGDIAPNRESTFLGCGCLLAPFLLIASLFVLNPIYNNLRLWQFERRFFSMSHVPQSKFIARTQEIGLFGNSNHCDFLVAEVRSFGGSQNAVRTFYRSTRIAVPNAADDGFQDVKNGTQPVGIEFLPSPLPKNYRWEFSSADRIDLSAVAGQKGLYVVAINNSGESYSWDSTCDLRCG